MRSPYWSEALSVLPVEGSDDQIEQQLAAQSAITVLELAQLRSPSTVG